ncbi:hypothetical protein ACIKT0_09445, partial [Hansschlegelia beijingensis]
QADECAALRPPRIHQPAAGRPRSLPAAAGPRPTESPRNITDADRLQARSAAELIEPVHHGTEFTVMTNEPPLDVQLKNLKNLELFGGPKSLPGDIVSIGAELWV